MNDFRKVSWTIPLPSAFTEKQSTKRDGIRSLWELLLISRIEKLGKIQVILFEIDCAIFYTNLHELFSQFISWTNWVNSGKFRDNSGISCQVMADMENFYANLIIINLYPHNLIFPICPIRQNFRDILEKKPNTGCLQYVLKIVSKVKATKGFYGHCSFWAILW